MAIQEKLSIYADKVINTDIQSIMNPVVDKRSLGSRNNAAISSQTHQVIP